MLARSYRLKRAALHYAAHGWPVAPAINYARKSWPRSPLTCACVKAKECAQPGAHPLDSDWQDTITTDSAQIQRWWSTQSSPNVLLAPGEAFEAWLAPPVLGEQAAAMLAQDRIMVPVVRSADGSWIFLTQPAAANASLSHIGVQRLTAGSYLAAPPSWHGAGRSDRWIAHPEVDALCAWEPVALLLLEAARRTSPRPDVGN
ncbi:MAG: bifunctional DNA primase/polymerase [Corynebacteriales bacterium]|nr:bifunctional DNA primase/polymerase [Mycobacteriales bacterium]